MLLLGFLACWRLLEWILAPGSFWSAGPWAGFSALWWFLEWILFFLAASELNSGFLAALGLYSVLLTASGLDSRLLSGLRLLGWILGSWRRARFADAQVSSENAIL